MHIVFVDAAAFIDGAHRVARFQPRIPERAQKMAERLLQRGAGFRSNQQQKIYIRMRKELAASISAYREQCKLVRYLRDEPLPGSLEHQSILLGSPGKFTANLQPYISADPEVRPTHNAASPESSFRIRKASST